VAALFVSVADGVGSISTYTAFEVPLLHPESFGVTVILARHVSLVLIVIAFVILSGRSPGTPGSSVPLISIPGAARRAKAKGEEVKPYFLRNPKWLHIERIKHKLDS
jgi:hypothetical protein